MNKSGERIFGWNTPFFLQASSKLKSISIVLNLKRNFLKIYLTNPNDFMLEVFFRTILFLRYMKILLRSFRFWDIENVKPKFQPMYTYKLYAYKKLWNVKKGNWFLRKLPFEIFSPNLFSNLHPICKNNFRKALFQFTKFNFAKLPENYLPENYLTLILIEWTLLNEFESPISKGDFMCKTTHKFRQK